MEFDWDRWDAEGKDLGQRMRGVAQRMEQQIAESRAARARYHEGSGGSDTVRESPPAVASRLDNLDQRLARVEETLSDIKREVRDIRERMATKVELESLKHDIRIVADGYAQTQTRLDTVADLMRRHVTATG